MNTRTYASVGGAAFAVVLTLSLVVVPALAAPSYTTVTASSVTSNPGNTVYAFSATADGTIPKVADSYIADQVLVFGYAWLDVGTSPASAVVATIHPAAGKDSTQNPNNWHAHTAELAPTADCSGGLQVVGLASPNAGVAITGNSITVTMNANSATVTPDTFDAATGFTLVLGSNGALCVAGP